MGWLPWDFTFLLSVHFKDSIILPLLNKHTHNMQQPVLCIFVRYYPSSYQFKGVYIFSYLCLHVLWGRKCVREAPDPENSQGLVGDDSSETWTSWLNTCSPAQRTLLTACMVGKRTKQSQSKTSCFMHDESTSDLSFHVGMGLYIHWLGCWESQAGRYHLLTVSLLVPTSSLPPALPQRECL